ncbi:MAG TPA: class I SAM-dependent methyltransferase [Myxococcales bacterium]|nr:class I SAM-dependent methyltransferase [Myxococcales bacterium]
MGRTPARRTAEELTRAAPAEDATRAHHRTDRVPARRRFDEVECTVSHLLRFPHPALRGRRFGEALLQGLAARGILPGPDGVLEIGGGTGHLAEAAWRGDAGPFTGCRWTSLDLSPSLLGAQRRRLLAVGAEPAAVPRGPHSRWAGVRADAVALPLRSGSFRGLVLGNEMLADLPVRGGVNAGAVQLVQEVARVLAPGGAAAFTEFGGEFPPGPVELTAGSRAGEHTEWSIDFRQLRAAATGGGLEAEELPLHELIGADLSVRCASYTDLWRLRRFVSCEVFAAPAEEVRRRHPLLSRLLALDLPPLGSPRWPDATAPAGFAQLFRALLLRQRR